MNVEVKIDKKLCTGCGACRDSCPTDVIRMKSSKAYVAYDEDCQGCFLCEFDCPVDAIYVKPRRYTEAERQELLDRLRRTCHFNPQL